MFGSMQCAPIGRSEIVLKIHGATVLCLAPCIVPLWVDHKMYCKSMEPPLWSHRAMFGSMHCSPMGRPLNVVKIYGAVVLCQAPCIVPLWVELGEAFGLSCNPLFGVTCWGN